MKIKNSIVFTIIINFTTAMMCMFDVLIWTISSESNVFAYSLNFSMGLALYGFSLVILSVAKQLTEGGQFFGIFIVSFLISSLCTNSLGFGLLISLLNFFWIKAFFQILYWNNLKFYPCRKGNGICVHTHNEVFSNF